MSETRLAGKVGLFVAVGLVLVALLLLNFSKGLNLWTPTYDLYLKARSVGGLQKGASVLLSGVNIGSVIGADVAEDNKGVIILLKIREKYRIHGDARFVIEQIGFLGDQYVAIYPQKNEAPPLEPGATVAVEEPFNLQEVVRSTTGLIQRVDETVKVLNAAISRVDQTVFSPETLTNLTTTVGNFKLVSERAVVMVDNVNKLVDTNSPPIATSVSNMVSFSEELERLAGEFRETVATNRVELTLAVKNLQTASRVLNNLAGDVDSGKGVAGALIKDEQLKNNLSSGVQHFSVLSSNLARFGLLYRPRTPRTNVLAAPIYPGRNPINPAK